MTDSFQRLLEDYGMYGGSFIVAFIAGVFPLFSIEVFLVVVTSAVMPSVGEMIVCCLFAAFGHQIAKTITYYAGIGAMERGKLKAKIERNRARIDRWNRAPHLILALAGAFGIPPLWILGFIAKPLMRIQFAAFTAIIIVTRFGRFIVLSAIPLIANA
jgi:membrane protein YqaA with SNARE-associated domain